MHHRYTCWRLLALTVAACCLAPLAGCQLLNMFSMQRLEPAKADIGKPGTELPAATALPSKCEYRLSQYLFFADFEIKRELPIFKELADLRENLHKTLQLPISHNNIIQVYLFEDQKRYESFMQAKYPDLPKRRAFFVAWPRRMGGEDLLVYTYWGKGERIQQDLRHELTHALLHSVLKDVPLWLDEGLAEYFELAPGQNGINPDHLHHLRHGQLGPIKTDLARLEQITEVEQMKPAEYREAWAWVHLMMHSNDEARKVLTGYLRELRNTKEPGPLRMRLSNVFPAPEMALERHLTLLEAAQRPTAAAK